jgi:excisionase family DNA binding protein
VLPTSQWLRVRQAAEVIGVSKKTMLTWADKGVGPRYTVLPSGERRYRLADINAWLRSREIKGKDN